MMGYTTYFSGHVNIDPPLNEDERQYLSEFAGSRRMDRDNGPYFVKGTDAFGQGRDPDIHDYNRPPEGQPGLWCQWVPDEHGDAIVWDEGEKFYSAAEWMAYLIDHFLKPNAEASKDLVASGRQDPRLLNFTFDHVLNGRIEAQGEDPEDRWDLVVENNQVLRAEAHFSWDEPRPLS